MPTAIVPHQYIVTDSLEGINNSLPVVRDYENKIYLKPEVGRVISVLIIYCIGCIISIILIILVVLIILLY